ncbi:right-handed parallel beta-helix repeat-containing protein [Peribacillus butanolivorans]|uniref:right-handed parallel beta-helix repeat-containing protein n=1 Tax=Peribacillus butanolivorans TaxID=421767 RepID=UPI00367D4A27
MGRRNFLRSIFIFICAFIFGFRVKKEYIDMSVETTKIDTAATNLLEYEEYRTVKEGSWDWSIALENAVLDTPVGGTLIIPDGIFEVERFIPKSGIVISGDGIIKRTANSSNNSILCIRDVSDLVIENITIDANDQHIPYTESTVSKRNCIALEGSAYNVTIKNVKLKNAGRDGIYIGEAKSGDGQYPENCTITNIEIDNATRNGISVVCGEFINIENPKITNYGLCGIDIEPNPLSTLNRNISVYRGTIIANSKAKSIPLQCTIGSAKEDKDKFSNITFYGVTIIGNGNPKASTVRNHKFDNVLIINNYIHNYVTGILAKGQSFIKGNKLSRPSTNVANGTKGAILVYGDTTVSSNIVNGAGYSGIVVINGNNSIITHNQVYDVGKVDNGYGIYTYGSESSIIVKNHCVDLQVVKTMECGIWIRLNENKGVKNIVRENISVGAKYSAFRIESPELQFKVSGNSTAFKNNIN